MKTSDSSIETSAVHNLPRHTTRRGAVTCCGTNGHWRTRRNNMATSLQKSWGVASILARSSHFLDLILEDLETLLACFQHLC